MAITINGSGTVTGISAGGLPDASIVKADLAANAVSFVSYAIIADQKAQNTGGGTFTSGAWRTRDLNTEITDPDGIVSISSNQFTLGAGSYLIRWSAPSYGTDRHQVRLYNITNSTSAGVSQSAYNAVTGAAVTATFGSARVVLAGTTVFEIQHQAQTTSATIGLGVGSNFGTEQYTTVEIFKES